MTSLPAAGGCIVDDVTRECLAAIPDTSISGRRAARERTALIKRRGKPGMIVSVGPSSPRTDARQQGRLAFHYARKADAEWLLLHASRKLMEKYNQLSAQQKISPDEAVCLHDEKNSKNDYEARFSDKLPEAMERGNRLPIGETSPRWNRSKPRMEISFVRPSIAIRAWNACFGRCKGARVISAWPRRRIVFGLRAES